MYTVFLALYIPITLLRVCCPLPYWSMRWNSWNSPFIFTCFECLALDLFMLLRLASSSCLCSCLILPEWWAYSCAPFPVFMQCWGSNLLFVQAMHSTNWATSPFLLFHFSVNFTDGWFWISFPILICHSYVFWVNCPVIDVFYKFLNRIPFFLFGCRILFQVFILC